MGVFWGRVSFLVKEFFEWTEFSIRYFYIVIRTSPAWKVWSPLLIPAPPRATALRTGKVVIIYDL